MSVVPSDEELFRRAQGGDGEAVDVFYRRHVAAVLTFVRRQVASSEQAFDLTAETFAKAVAALEQFDPERGSARGWVFAIAGNEVRQAVRRGRVEDRVRRELGMSPIVLDDPALARLESRFDDSALAEALAELSADERDAIGARVLEDRS